MNPVLVDTPKNVWTKIASEVLQGLVEKVKATPDTYYFTTVQAGGAAPAVTDPKDPAFLGVPRFISGNRTLVIENSEPIDVYALCLGDDGRVLVML